jgi:hypothetical protein
VTYTVKIDDSFHYMDEGERVEHGVFASLEEAVAAAKRIVDEFLIEHYEPGMSADELYRYYTAFGDDPFIIEREPGVPFSAWTYAKARSQQLAAGGES